MYVEKIGIYQIFQLVNIFEVVLFTYKFVHVSFFFLHFVEILG